MALDLNLIKPAKIGAGEIATVSSVNSAIDNYNPAAVINSGTTTIDGGKITTGSIRANQIAASTITAGQIAANTILGNNIKAATISGDRLISNTVVALTTVAASTLVAYIPNGYVHPTAVYPDQYIYEYPASAGSFVATSNKMLIQLSINAHVDRYRFASKDSSDATIRFSFNLYKNGVIIRNDSDISYLKCMNWDIYYSGNSAFSSSYYLTNLIIGETYSIELSCATAFYLSSTNQIIPTASWVGNSGNGNCGRFYYTYYVTIIENKV